MKNKKILIVIIGLLIILFFIIEYKNYKDKQNSEFSLNSTLSCMKICEPIYNEDKNLLGEEKSITPKYFYNSEDRNCYYSGGIDYFLETNKKIKNVVFKHVKKCATGETLLYFSTLLDSNYKNCTVAKECTYTLDDFVKKEKEIMKN
jgi:hypothetical protein